jgi:hypothetical protein
MKTKDFVKMLQEADPTGEAHVRMSGGFPHMAILLPGYYDGSYSYLDEEGNYVVSRAGTKVDIYMMGIEEFVEHNYDPKDPNNWEKIKSMIKFDSLLGDAAYQQNRKDAVINAARANWEHEVEMQEKYHGPAAHKVTDTFHGKSEMS